MFSSASEVFINALCRVVTTYKIVVFKFRFVGVLYSTYPQKCWMPVRSSSAAAAPSPAPMQAVKRSSVSRHRAVPSAAIYSCQKARFTVVKALKISGVMVLPLRNVMPR